ncbi:MAG: S9 family peptidase [Pseudomonadota bacterium]
MRLVGLLLTSLLFGGHLAVAEYPRPPLEAYGALPQISDAELSPDGTKVAAIANVANGTRMIVFDLHGGGISDPIGIENLKARGVEFFDNRHVILRASETKTTFGFRGEYEYSGAFAIDIETNDIKTLLKSTRELFPAQSGLGKIVGRGPNDGEILMPAFMGERYSEPSYDLLKVRLRNPAGKNYMRGTGDTRDWFVGKSGKVLARERYNNKHNMFRVQWRNGSKWNTIYEREQDIPMSILAIMPDESGLVFSRILDDEIGLNGLMKLGSDGEITGPIIPASDAMIERILTDNNRALIGVQYAGVEPDYVFLDKQLQSSFDHVSQALPDATIYMDSWSDDRGVILYHVFAADLGDTWLIHKTADNSLAMVANRRPDIPPAATGYMMSIEYAARDDLKIQAILTVPPDYDPQNSAPLPTLVMPHGGPAAYDRFDFDWMAQYFANRGFAVLQPNFRGSTGFGRAFEDAGRGEWGGRMQDDITDGVNALINSKITDPNRVCIAGASYGGYAALAGAVFTPDLYKCVIAIAPVSDLNQMLRAERRDHGNNHWVIQYWTNLMADGDARRAKLRSISPVNFAADTTAPVLLLHGNDDTVVPYEQSQKMAQALRQAGKSVELVKLKGEDHWLSVADTRLQTLREMDRFIAEHMPIE